MLWIRPTLYFVALGLVFAGLSGCGRREAVVEQPPPPTKAEIWAAIQPRAVRYRMAPAFIYALVAAESNFDHKAKNGSARGLMQLMPTTARRFNAGDALDPRQNILAGSRYLSWLLSYFHQDLPLALAAYNAGEGAVVNAGYRIPQNAETLRYVPSVLALYRGTSGAM